MMETSFPALRPIRWLGCLTHTPIYEQAIDSTDTPYRAPSLLSETVAKSCTELILTRCDIEQLPELIGMYYLLRVLNVSENALVELPPDIGSCFSLKELNFSSNMIKVIPDELSQLIFLEKLHGYSNKIVTLPDWLGNLEKLEEVNFFNNKVLHLPPTLGNLMQAVEINLAANVMMQLHAESLTNLKSVTVLNLYDCRLMKVADLGGLKNLEELRMFNNNLSEMPEWTTGGKRGLPKLRILELNQNQIEKISLEHFIGLDSLEKCVMNRNNIAEWPTGVHCPKLESLILSENKLATLPPDLPLMPSLKVLFLAGNQLETLPATFLQLKKIERVNLSRNPKLRATSTHIAAHLKKTCEASKGGQFWAPDTI